MRGLLNLLISFLIIAILFNYQFYYIKKSMTKFDENIAKLDEYSDMYDIENIEKYFTTNYGEYGKEEYYIPYDEYMLNSDDILDEKLAIINYENSEVESLIKVKCESIVSSDFYLLNDLRVVSKKVVNKKKLKDKIICEFYIGKSDNRLILIAGRPEINITKPEGSRFVVSGIKLSINEDRFNEIKKECKKLYSTDCIWVKDVYIMLEDKD